MYLSYHTFTGIIIRSYNMQLNLLIFIFIRISWQVCVYDMHTIINIINMTRSISLGCKTMYGFMDWKINEHEHIFCRKNNHFRGGYMNIAGVNGTVKWTYLGNMAFGSNIILFLFWKIQMEFCKRSHTRLLVNWCFSISTG